MNANEDTMDGRVVEAEVVEDGAQVPVVQKVMCTCCEPPHELGIGKGNPFGICKNKLTVYEVQESGEYAVTTYRYERELGRIVDPETNVQIYPAPEEAPSSDDILNNMRGDDETDSEKPAGSKPEQQPRGRVNLDGSDYY